MAPEQIFSLANTAAMIGWAILVFSPRRLKPLFMIPKYLIPFGLSLLYAGLALTTFFIADGGYSSIASVRTLFLNDSMLLAGWVHYLAFDLFIGSWIAEKADDMGISRLIQGPILVATFMFGPIGLALFLSMRLGLIGRGGMHRAEAVT